MITNEVYFFKNQSSVSTSDSLYNVNDGTLILQVDGNVSNLELLVLGNTDLIDDDFVALKTINATDYSMSDKITSTCIYWIDINGIRKIKLNLSKITGSVNVKALTKRGLTTDLVARAMAANASGGGSYTLPVASADTLGGIKIGENLTIDENGVVSASGGEIKFYSIYLDTTLNQNSTLYLHNLSSPYNTELKEFISNVMTECANKNYNSILILIRFKCNNSIQQVPYLLLAFDSTYKISSANNKYRVVSIGNEVLQNRIFYKYRIDINGTWSDNVFIVSTIIGSRDKHEFISTETGLTKTNTSSYTPTGDYNPATKKYVDDAITTAITTSLEGSY